MDRKNFYFVIRWFYLSFLILLFFSPVYSQHTYYLNSGWMPLKDFEEKIIQLNTKSVSVWNDYNEIFNDSTTFTEVATPFPGVMAGDAVWFDYDNDGDLDIIVSGLTDSKNFLTQIFRNDNGDFIDIEAPIIPLWTERGVAWGDYDNDGDFDLAIQGRVDTTGFNNVTKIYRNESGNLIDINAPLMGLCGGSVLWADFDNDGFLDLLISGSPDNGSTFYTKIYKNDSNNFIEINVDLPGVWGSSIAAADYDNDGDLDILLTGYGDYSTITRLYRNELQNNNLTFINTNSQIQAVNSSAVAFGDYNNDGYVDFALSGISFGKPVTKIYKIIME